MNRLLAAITPVRTAFLAVGLVVGVASGAAAASDPVTKAPYQCRVMANLAGDTFGAYEDQVVAHHNRATRGLSKFDQYDAETKRLWADIDELKAKHTAARKACLGEGR